MHRIHIYVLRVFSDPAHPEGLVGTLQAVEWDVPQAFTTPAGLLTLLAEQLSAASEETSPGAESPPNAAPAGTQLPESTVPDS
jgi:hypothetical protein